MTRVMMMVWIVGCGSSGGSGSVDAPSGRDAAVDAAPFELAPQVTYAVGRAPGKISVGDVDGDGKPDLVVTGVEVSILHNNGDGTFIAITAPSIGAQSIAIVDVDGDHVPDLVTADGCSQTVSVLIATGPATYAPAVSYLVSATDCVFDLVVRDLDGDGKPDIATADSQANVLRNHGDGTFEAPVTYAAGDDPYGIAIADFNDDGKLDLVLANRGLQSDVRASVFLNNGDGTFATQVFYNTGGVPEAVAVGDLDGDGKQDLAFAIGNISSTTVRGVSVLLGRGDGTFVTPSNVFSTGETSDPLAIAIGDVTGDGRPDLAVADGTGNVLNFLDGDGTGLFAAPRPYPVGQFPAGVAIADLDGDGKLDVVVSNFMDSTISVLLAK